MVRKRPHKHESDDDSDEDSDYSPANDNPQPKRYSLRTRKKQTFCEEFDYDIDDSDLSPRRQSSDDDYQLEYNGHAGFAHFLEPALPSIQPDLAAIEPATQVDTENGGLIDFEDIIRADIVINRNRIDYDRMINTTEIKVSKRRGRPPKGHKEDDDYVPESEECENVLEPETEVTESSKENLIKAPHDHDKSEQAVAETANSKSSDDEHQEESQTCSESLPESETEVQEKNKDEDADPPQLVDTKTLVETKIEAVEDLDDVIILDDKPEVIVLDD